MNVQTVFPGWVLFLILWHFIPELLLVALLVLIPLCGAVSLWKGNLSRFVEKHLVESWVMKRVIRFTAIIVSTLVLVPLAALGFGLFRICFTFFLDPNLFEDARDREFYANALAHNRVNGLHALIVLLCIALIFVLVALVFRRCDRAEHGVKTSSTPARPLVLVPLFVLVSLVILSILTRTFPDYYGFTFPLMAHTGLSSSGPAPRPLAVSIAGRIAMNDPDGPKTYDALLKAMGTAGKTEYERQGLQQEALQLVLVKAKAAEDVDLLACFLESDSIGWRINAACAIRKKPTAARTLGMWSDILKNDPRRDMQLQAVYGIARLNEMRGHVDKSMPRFPGMHESDADFAACMTQWREWWEANKTRAMALVGAKKE